MGHSGQLRGCRRPNLLPPCNLVSSLLYLSTAPECKAPSPGRGPGAGGIGEDAIERRKMWKDSHCPFPARLPGTLKLVAASGTRREAQGHDGRPRKSPDEPHAPKGPDRGERVQPLATPATRTFLTCTPFSQLDMKIGALADVMQRQNGLIPGMAPSTSRDHSEAMLYANTQKILFVTPPPLSAVAPHIPRCFSHAP